jgi:hypothetical protein
VDSGRLSAEELAEIRARCEAATPGPWSWLCEDLADHPGQTSACACLYGDGERVNPATGDLTIVLVADLDGTTPSGADMDFVRHARHDIPALLAEIDRLRTAITEHHAQKADDRCIEDDDRLYAAAGLPPCDRRVGSKEDMLANCARFIERRCEGGGWPSYRELEVEIDRLKSIVQSLAGRVAAQSELLSKRAEK